MAPSVPKEQQGASKTFFLLTFFLDTALDQYFIGLILEYNTLKGYRTPSGVRGALNNASLSVQYPKSSFSTGGSDWVGGRQGGTFPSAPAP